MSILDISVTLNIVLITSIIIGVLKYQKALREIKDIALTDRLTGVNNRRYFDTYIQKIFPLMKRMDRAFHYVIMDIDNFKMLNDTYGHHAGDVVLKQVATLINGNVRDEDCFSRFGGEEFVMILSNARQREIKKVIDRLRRKVEDMVIIYNNKPIKVTLSIGVTRYERNDEVKDLLLKADKALYEAKSTGKNKVCYYTHEMGEVK
jgi:diguanylate cyclase (GGDEF)-like protein